jgi:hypothetical protein
VNVSGEEFVFLYSWFLLISHWKGISQSNKESSGLSVIAPVDSSAVRDSCEFFNHTTYVHGWKVALYAPACLHVSSCHSRTSDELLQKTVLLWIKKNWHLDVTVCTYRVTAWQQDADERRGETE